MNLSMEHYLKQIELQMDEMRKDIQMRMSECCLESKCRHIDYHILDITKQYLVVNEKP